LGKLDGKKDREGKGKNEQGDEVHLTYDEYLDRVNKMALENYKAVKKTKEMSVKGNSTMFPARSTMTH